MLAKKMRTNEETSPGKMASERRRSKVRQRFRYPDIS